MRKLSSKLAGQQSGFTLIELVIVIVIIGILAAVALPNFSSLSDDAKKAKCSAILGSVKSAYAIALAKNSGVASGASVIAAQTDPSCSGTGSAVCGDATITIPATVITSTSQIIGTSCAGVTGWTG